MKRRDTARALLLLDFDGTLTPIRPRPDQVELGSRVRGLLRELGRRDGLIVGIVSGRSVAMLQLLVRVPGIVYVGNHGLELEGRGLRFAHEGAKRSEPLLRRIARQLRQALRDLPGAVVESKRLSLSAHWRQVPAARARVFHRRIRSVLEPRARQVKVTRGSYVVEIRPPVAWHKGSAVEWLRRKLKVPGSRVIYFGDDQTDEDAFRSVNRMGGFSVRVGGAGRSAAARRLRSPADVEQVLANMRALPWNK